MGIGLIIAAVCLVYIAICVLFAIFRKTPRARIRFFTILGSAVVAFVLTLVLKVLIVNFPLDAIPAVGDTFTKLTTEMPGLTVLVEKLAYALIAPMVFMLLFIILCIVTWIVYFIVTLVLAKLLKKGRKSIAKSSIYGALQALVVIIVMLAPISFYAQIAPAVLDGVSSTDTVNVDEIEGIEYVRSLDKSLAIYRVCGGDLITNSLTDFKVEGVGRIRIRNEISTATTILMDISDMTKIKDFTKLGSEEADLLRKLATDFNNSKLLSAAAGELVYSATDKWIAGEKFFGVGAPTSNETLGPMLNKTLTILNADSRNSELLAEDINTAVEVIALMAESQVLAQTSNTENMIKTLSTGTVTHDIILTLSSNTRMKVLIEDFTVMGVTAIATAINIPNDTEEVYNDFILNVTDAVINARTLPSADRANALSTELESILNKSGVKIDKSMVRCVAIALLEDVDGISGTENVSQAVRNFFSAYGQASGDNTNMNVNFVAGNTDGSDHVIDLATASGSNFARALGNIVKQTKTIPADSPTRGDQIEIIVRGALEGMLQDKDPADKEAIIAAIKTSLMTATDATASSKNIASLRSAQTINTALVTLDDIMKARSGTQSSMTPEAEATAFANILKKGIEIIDLMGKSGDQKPNVTTISASVGSLLNLIKELPYIGSDATGQLFIAMAQSELVVELFGNNTIEAKALASEVIKIGDYEQAFRAVSVGMKMLDSVSNNQLTKTEDVTEIIEVITPETVEIFQNRFTPENLKDYGFAEDKTDSTSGIITSLMGNIAEHDQEARAEDVESVKHILNIAIVASEKNAVQGDVVGEEGVLGDTDDLVSSILNSELGCETLTGDMMENGEVKSEYHDAFGIADKLTESDSIKLQQSIDNYVAQNPGKTQEAAALLALFGIQQ